MTTFDEAFASLAERARRSESCPELETIWAAANGELSVEEARRWMAHGGDCPACAEAWRLAREMSERFRNESVATGPARAAKIPSWTIWGGLAAAAVLTIVLVAPRLLEDPSPAVYRDDVAAPIHSLLPEDRPLRRDDCVLRWTTGPPGATYRLEVATHAEGVLDSRRDLAEPEYLVPQELLAGIVPGSQLLWRVTVVYPDGREESSVTFISRLE